MIITGNGSKAYFTDVYSNKDYPVENLPKDYSKLKEDIYYVVGENLYRYIGSRRNLITFKEPGAICSVHGKYYLNHYKTPEDKRYYHIVNVDVDVEEDDQDMDDIISSYIYSYNNNSNLMVANKQKMLNTGEVYIPELKPTDDALTRIMKLMIIHLGVMPSKYKGTCEKEYTLDNLISALNGATHSMTINRFLAWCEILGLKWEVELIDNGTDKINPLTEPILIADDKPLTCELGEISRSLFKVPLKEDEDPLKRIIKVCIIKKNMCLVDYKDKGSTPHLLNNMRSSLKRSGRMMISYFVSWCEILGVDFKLRVINPEDGVMYEADGNYRADDDLYGIE